MKILHAALAALVLTAVTPLSAQQRPNIVVIMTDDQTMESLSQTSIVLTPSGPHDAMFIALMRQGVIFNNSYVSVALCEPSRGGFLTGQYSHNNGITTNSVSSYAALNESNMLAIWLQNAGYRTAQIGKYLNDYPSKHGPGSVPPGWNDFYSFYPTPDYFNYTINNNGSMESHGATVADYSTDVLAAEAARFIGATSSPFFMWLTLNAPHDPFTPPPRYVGLLDNLYPPADPSINELSANLARKPAWVRGLPLIGGAGTNVYYPWIVPKYRDRLLTLQAVDDAINVVMSALTNSGALANTYVFFTSDNGYMRGQHRIPYNKENGYDPSSKVPLVVVGPGVLQSWTRSELVLNLDLTATIVALAGAAPGLVLDGQSILPLLTNPEPQPTFRNYLMTELMVDFPENYPVPTGPNYVVPAFNMLRAFAYKYMKNDVGEEELYDMVDDVYELNSVHADPNFASTLATFRARLPLMKNCVGAQCIQ